MLLYLGEMYETAKKMVNYSMDIFLNEKLELKSKVMITKKKYMLCRKKH